MMPQPMITDVNQSPRRQTIVPRLPLNHSENLLHKNNIEQQMDQGKLNNLHQLVEKLKQQRAQKK